MTAATFLLIAALVCFILAACSVPRAQWTPIGLALCVASSLIEGGLLRGLLR